MTTPQVTGLDVRALVADFVLLNPIADPWADAELEDSEDCDVVSSAFTAHCLARGAEAFTVRVEMTSPFEAILGEHYFTVLGVGVAVDFTARQFHNVEGVHLDIEEIPFPLVFLWPGDYPLSTLTATRAATVDHTVG